MMRAGPTFDHERVSFNLAKLRKGGEDFEIVIDPDAAITYKEALHEGEEPVSVSEVVKAEKVFADAKKGLLASEEHMSTVFGTTNPVAVAQIILREGEIQLTADHRARIREEKQQRLLEHIRRHAADPKTGLPHPMKRLELAFEEAKIKIDMNRRVNAQIKDVVAKLQPILPLRFEDVTYRVHLGPQEAQRLYGDVKGFGELRQEEWLNDGSWVCHVKIPAGLQHELVDMLNEKTHGQVDVEKVK